MSNAENKWQGIPQPSGGKINGIDITTWPAPGVYSEDQGFRDSGDEHKERSPQTIDNLIAERRQRGIYTSIRQARADLNQALRCLQRAQSVLDDLEEAQR